MAYGMGVEQDCVKALAWYEKAAGQDNEKAQEHLNALNKS